MRERRLNRSSKSDALRNKPASWNVERNQLRGGVRRLRRFVPQDRDDEICVSRQELSTVEAA
jgi:hypothetical protein